MVVVQFGFAHSIQTPCPRAATDDDTLLHSTQRYREKNKTTKQYSQQLFRSCIDQAHFYQLSAGSGQSFCHDWLSFIAVSQRQLGNGHSTSEVSPATTVCWFQCSTPQQTKTAVDCVSS